MTQQRQKKWPEMTEEERRKEMAKYTWRNGAKVRKPTKS